MDGDVLLRQAARVAWAIFSGNRDGATSGFARMAAMAWLMRSGLQRALDLRDLTCGSTGTGHGFTPQISAAYSAMVRSLENFPELAMFRMAFRAHSCGSAYSSSSDGPPPDRI